MRVARLRERDCGVVQVRDEFGDDRIEVGWLKGWCEAEVSMLACSAVIAALVALAFLTGCAQTLPALSTGLDGARNVIAVSCPARTPPCETFMSLHNVGVKAYNNALLAEAVGEDASAYEAEGMAALKQLWAALMQVKP